MGTKRLVNLAALLCAVGLLAILVLPESMGAGMRTAGILVFMVLAFLVIFRSRSDTERVRNLAAELASAKTEIEDIEERARSIIDGVPDPTVVVDNQYGVSVVNKAARENNPDMVQKVMDHTPLGRPGKPSDIVGPAIFLASDLSAYVTGGIVMADGGFRSI